MKKIWSNWKYYLFYKNDSQFVEISIIMIIIRRRKYEKYIKNIFKSVYLKTNWNKIYI